LLLAAQSQIGLHDLKHLQKGTVDRMMRVLGKSGLRVVSSLPCFRGGVGSEILLEQVQLNFSFQNNFTILLVYGPLEGNNTFSKCAFLKVLLSTLTMVVMS
jgi:hypothetical protein